MRHRMGAPNINRRLSSVFTRSLLSGERRDDPHRMNQTGDIPEYRQEDVDPEMLGQSHLQEYPKRRKDDREHDP